MSSVVTGAAAKKAAVPCGTAEFREETSKKGKHPGKPECCDATSRTSHVAAQEIFCGAAKRAALPCRGGSGTGIA